MLVQGCMDGIVFPITRRPHDRERTSLVKSGNVFVYTESDAGIKRWTDGINWSPSRILNNFLVYREMDKAFPPGEKKKATKKPKRYSPYDASQRPNQGSMQGPHDQDRDFYPGNGIPKGVTREMERLLVGSLNDSYSFKHGGLIKKTISVTYGTQVWHVVWYYSFQDHLVKKFRTPEMDPRFKDMILDTSLFKDQAFRVPLNADGSEGPAVGRDRLPFENDGENRNPRQGAFDSIPVNIAQNGGAYYPFGSHPMQHHAAYNPPSRLLEPSPHFNPFDHFQGNHQQNHTDSGHMHNFQQTHGQPAINHFGQLLEPNQHLGTTGGEINAFLNTDAHVRGNTHIGPSSPASSMQSTESAESQSELRLPPLFPQPGGQRQQHRLMMALDARRIERQTVQLRTPDEATTAWDLGISHRSQYAQDPMPPFMLSMNNINAQQQQGTAHMIAPFMFGQQNNLSFDSPGLSNQLGVRMATLPQQVHENQHHGQTAELNMDQGDIEPSIDQQDESRHLASLSQQTSNVVDYREGNPITPISEEWEDNGSDGAGNLGSDLDSATPQQYAPTASM